LDVYEILLVDIRQARDNDLGTDKPLDAVVFADKGVHSIGGNDELVCDLKLLAARKLRPGSS